MEQRRNRRYKARSLGCLVLGVLLVASVSVLWYLSHFIQYFIDDDIASESGPEFSYDNGSWDPMGGWTFSLKGYHYFNVKKFPVKVLLRECAKEIVEHRSFSIGTWISAWESIFDRWNRSQEKLVEDIGPPFVVMNLTQNRLAYQPGEGIRISGSVRISDTADRIARKRGWVPKMGYAMDRVFDESGRFRSPMQFGMGTLLTTTGAPIQSSLMSLRNAGLGSPYASPIEGLADLELVGEREYTVDFHETVQDSTPGGMFRMTLQVGTVTEFGWVQIENWGELDKVLNGGFTSVFDMVVNRRWIMQGPVFSVGDVKTLRMPWTLLNFTYSSQSRGIAAQEDENLFALSLTGVHQNTIVVPPFDAKGQPLVYDLSPFFPTQAVSYGQVSSVDETASSCAYYPPIPLDTNAGAWSVEIRGPTDELVLQDSGVFDRITYYRGFSDRLRFSFPDYGRYTIRLHGWIEDIYGHRMEGGGTYALYAALPLSFSSSSKPGQGYPRGASMNTRLHVFPPGNTRVRFTLDFFPTSDPDRSVHWERGGVSNAFGYYYPSPDEAMPPFDTVGEYRADFEVWQTDPRGALHYGNVREHGIVYDPETVLDLRGFESMPSRCASIPDPGAKNASISSSFRVPTGCPGSSQKIQFLPDDQTEVTILSDTEGNSTAIFPTLAWKLDPDPGFSKNPWADRSVPLTHGEISCTKPGCYWDQLSGRADQPPRPEWFSQHITNNVYFNADHPAPMVSTTTTGFHPALYPEDVDIQSYCYISAFRPGMVLRNEVLDDTFTEPYWEIAPDTSGHQINARKQGDVRNDHYRLLGSCVRKEKSTGHVFYGYYAAAVSISPASSNQNGLYFGGQTPLVEIAGEPIYRLIGSAPEPGTIFTVAEPVGVGGFVLPTTPDLSIKTTIFRPDGTTETRNSRTNRYGEYRADPLSSGDRAGIAWVEVEAPGVDGHNARILGSADNRILQFIASTDHGAVELNVNSGTQLAAHSRLRVIGQAPEGIVSGRAAYVRITPGGILDQGIVPLTPAGLFSFSFSPAADTVKMGFYRTEITDVARAINDLPKFEGDGNIQLTTVFVEGLDSTGNVRTASGYFMMKGARVLYVDRPMAEPPTPIAQNLYAERPIIPDLMNRVRRIESVADCRICHNRPSQFAEIAVKRPAAQWRTIMNWHRAKSVNLFWLPSQDAIKLEDRISQSTDEIAARHSREAILETHCGTCHISHRKMNKREIQYTADGWRRYVDYRYPPSRLDTVPGQKWSHLRRFIPEPCLTCHTTRILRATPPIEPLDAEERSALLDALNQELGGEESLPTNSTSSGPSKEAYVRECYRCHTADLIRAEADSRLSGFVREHLLDKQSSQARESDILEIEEYFRSTFQKDTNNR